MIRDIIEILFQSNFPQYCILPSKMKQNMVFSKNGTDLYLNAHAHWIVCSRMQLTVSEPH